MEIQEGDIVEFTHEGNGSGSPDVTRQAEVVWSNDDSFGVTWDGKKNPGIVSLEEDGWQDGYQPTINQSRRPLHNIEKVGSLDEVG